MLSDDRTPQASTQTPTKKTCYLGNFLRMAATIDDFLLSPLLLIFFVVDAHPGNIHSNSHIHLEDNAPAKTSGRCTTQLAKMSTTVSTQKLSNSEMTCLEYFYQTSQRSTHATTVPTYNQITAQLVGGKQSYHQDWRARQHTKTSQHQHRQRSSTTQHTAHTIIAAIVPTAGSHYFCRKQ